MSLTAVEPTVKRQCAPVVDKETPTPLIQHIVTLVILFGPVVGVIFAAAMFFRDETTFLSLGLAVVFYAIAGHGVTGGFHRMCTHRAFKATRVTKILIVIAGSLAFEGGVLAWVANHRKHHAYTDVAGDPHSPHLVGNSMKERTRGAVHAHVGWLFTAPPCDIARWAPDLANDHDLVVIDRLFPLWCVVSLGLPTLFGFLISGTASGALGGFIWGGLLRVFVLQHATFAVNSVCHLWGKQPFATRSDDRARNFAPLMILSMGENWHNLHHSLPRLARHGVQRHEWDSTARILWCLEKMGQISDVRWPDEAALDCRRRQCSEDLVDESCDLVEIS